ncbi:MAG: biotin--[acetyl-CoA-carboxylase] ligase [Synergistaceae bacterium]|jgi:BirA family biotin operon repressor/biotin-[acetyl-CoA-carboxylase] ligase|nr:biotin--[acetyl-CoA-carboxylase] ligase [Synergistaceae bacterium]
MGQETREAGLAKDRVLALLEEQAGEIVTGEELARKLGVSRVAVWKIIKLLQERGCAIESVSRRGYRFVSRNGVLSEVFIQSGLKTRFLGRRLEVLKSVDSTNAYIRRMDLTSTEAGFVVVADGQTKGKGRKNRPFLSLPGEGLYMSILLKPDIPADETRFLTICAGLAVCEAIEALYDLNPQIKWVNDVWCDGKKLCGILTEGAVSLELQRMSHVVIGIGVNTGSVGEDLREIATSLGQLTGGSPDRNELAAEILNRLEPFCIALAEGRKKELLDAYRSRQYVLGRTVQVFTGTETFSALATGIDDGGALIVENETGRIRLSSEEVSLKLK